MPGPRHDARDRSAGHELASAGALSHFSSACEGTQARYLIRVVAAPNDGTDGREHGTGGEARGALRSNGQGDLLRCRRSPMRTCEAAAVCRCSARTTSVLRRSRLRRSLMGGDEARARPRAMRLPRCSSGALTTISDHVIARPRLEIGEAAAGLAGSRVPRSVTRMTLKRSQDPRVQAVCTARRVDDRSASGRSWKTACGRLRIP